MISAEGYSEILKPKLEVLFKRDVPKVLPWKITQAVFEAIVEASIGNDKVALGGIGTFEIRKPPVRGFGGQSSALEGKIPFMPTMHWKVSSKVKARMLKEMCNYIAE